VFELYDENFDRQTREVGQLVQELNYFFLNREV
jgi:hypothetical protein